MADKKIAYESDKKDDETTENIDQDADDIRGGRFEGGLRLNDVQDVELFFNENDGYYYYYTGGSDDDIEVVDIRLYEYDEKEQLWTENIDQDDN